jgi:hypothetical protein
MFGVGQLIGGSAGLQAHFQSQPLATKVESHWQYLVGQVVTPVTGSQVGFCGTVLVA